MTDSEILELFHSEHGKERAFTLLMNQYQEKIYWHVRRMVNNHDDADDVLQNTFVKAWKGLENFRADAQLFTWLYRIATNEALNHLSSAKRKATVTFEGTKSEDDDSYAPSNYVKSDPYFNGDEIQQKLQQAINTLPEKQKQVFLLRYYDEMPYEQMSEILGTSVGALKASYHFAAQKIESFLLNRD